jgi:hypothetical protein
MRNIGLSCSSSYKNHKFLLNRRIHIQDKDVNSYEALKVRFYWANFHEIRNHSTNPTEFIRIGSNMYKIQKQLQFFPPIFIEILHYVEIFFNVLYPNWAKLWDILLTSRYIYRAFLYNWLTPTNKCTKTSLSLIYLLKDYPNNLWIISHHVV